MAGVLYLPPPAFTAAAWPRRARKSAGGGSFRVANAAGCRSCVKSEAWYLHPRSARGRLEPLDLGAANDRNQTQPAVHRGVDEARSTRLYRARAYPATPQGPVGPGKSRHPLKGGGYFVSVVAATHYLPAGRRDPAVPPAVMLGPGGGFSLRRHAGLPEELVCGGLRIWAKNRLRRCQCRYAVQKKSMLF
jgi:hypothetical protein